MALEDIRRTLEGQVKKRLGSPLTDAEWEWLVRMDRVEAAEYGGDERIKDLVDDVAEGREAFAGRPRRDRQPAEPTRNASELAQRAKSHAEALSVLLAADAARRADVGDFRREELRGKLLDPKRIQDWIERRSKLGKPRARKVLGAPDEPGAENAEKIDGLPVIEYRAPTVQYAIPGGRWVVSAISSSKLERLRHLSERLAHDYGWQPAQATAFVLTGVVPMLEPVRVRMHYRAVRASSRIELDIDPTTTPQEVARAYATARSRLLEGRTRRMEPEQLQLAIFADSEREGTWRERMNAWNKLHPKWRYRHPTNFQRAATKAIRRLLEPPIKD